MKKSILKNIFALTLLAFAAIGCAPAHQDTWQSKKVSFQVSPTENDVTLISRYTGGDYVTAAYSFRHLSQDVNLTRNNWEILFEAREDFADHFIVNTVVDDNSFIYDLGKRSCKDITSTYPEDRTNRPLVWLAYSDADPSDLTPERSALVKEGHCYLTYNNDEDGRVVALFHIKKHEKSRTVTIDEIEVLDVLSKH